MPQPETKFITGLMQPSFMQQSGVVQPALMQPGLVQGGLMVGGLMQGGLMQGGLMPGGLMQGCIFQPGAQIGLVQPSLLSEQGAGGHGSDSDIHAEVIKLRKQVDDMKQEKQEILISHSKEVVSLRNEIVDLKIVKQRNDILKLDLKKEKQKSEDRGRELHEERRKRRSAEKWVKEMESQLTGKPIDKLEAQKRERVKAAEKQKEEFRKQLEKKGGCDSSMRQKRRFIDEDSWVVDRGVTIQKLSEKRGRLDQEGGDGWKEKEVVERDQGQESQEKSVVNEGEAELDQETGDKVRKGVKQRFIACSGCGMKVNISSVIKLICV